MEDFLMAKYKLKEGKSLDDFPQSGGIGRSIFVALKNNGEFIQKWLKKTQHLKLLKIKEINNGYRY